MRAVGVNRLKKKLSEYVRLAAGGETASERLPRLDFALASITIEAAPARADDRNSRRRAGVPTHPCNQKRERSLLMPARDIATHPIHLGLGASASIEPPFTGSMDWYAAYETRHTRDGVEGRLVSMHDFTESWRMWEMHPHGSEVVLCTRGFMTLHQESGDGTVSSIVLGPGQYAVWATRDGARFTPCGRK